MTRVRTSVVSAAALLALLVTAAVPATAGAAGSFPYDPAQTVPEQSLNFTAGPGPMTFRVVSRDCPGAAVHIEVASENVFGPDDTLIDTARKDYFTLTETSPGVYDGSTGAQWLQTPGTYYWLAQTIHKCTDIYDVPRVSPVRAIVVNVAPPAPGADIYAEIPEDSEILSIALAKSEIPRIILKRTKRIARGLKRRCSRRGAGSILVVFCTVSWNDKKKYRYNGSMRLTGNDDGSIAMRFDGRRATLKCWKRKQRAKRRASSCYKRWRFEYESV